MSEINDISLSILCHFEYCHTSTIKWSPWTIHGMAIVHGIYSSAIYEGGIRCWVLVSRVYPGGPYLVQWTVTGHNFWGDWMLLPY